MGVFRVFYSLSIVNQFSDLPPDLRALFHSRASRLEGTSGEDLYNLVPERLRDSASETRTYLQGSEELGIEGRDVSHFQSSDNGGSDTIDNLGFENQSINRSEGANNFTNERHQQMLEDNASDAELIDAHITDDLAPAVSITEATTEGLVGETLGEVAVDVVSDLLLPTIGGVMAGRYAYKHTQGSKNSKVIACGLTGGATMGLLTVTPFVREVFLAYSVYRIAKSTGILSKLGKYFTTEFEPITWK